MADTVKLQLDQIDEETGKAISQVVCEWYGVDRNEANALSMGMAQAVVGALTEASAAKAEVTGSSEVAKSLFTKTKGK